MNEAAETSEVFSAGRAYSENPTHLSHRFLLELPEVRSAGGRSIRSDGRSSPDSQ